MYACKTNHKNILQEKIKNGQSPDVNLKLDILFILYYLIMILFHKIISKFIIPF